MADTFAPYAYSHLQTPAFEASSTDYRNAHRKAILGDQDAVVSGEYLFLQSRCRYVIRNNPTASAARDKHVTNGGSLTVKWFTKDGKSHELANELWEEFAANPSYDNHGNLAAIQAVWRSEQFESGESFSRMVIDKRDNTNRIPLKLHNIGSEYLDIGYNGYDLTEDYVAGRTRYGITFDKATLTKPEYYNFFKDLYYSNVIPAESYKRVQVPARDVLHSFERKSAGQWRGIPLLAPCLIALYEADDLCTATVRAQTSASAITWVVSNQQGPAPEAGGTVSMLGRNYLSDTVKQLAFDTSGGTVQYTNGTFNLVQSRDIGSNLMVLLREEYQKISAALNIAYHQLTNDTSGLDFSSLRGILSAQRQRIEFLYNIKDIPDKLVPLTRRFKDVSIALGYELNDAYPSYQFPRYYGVDDLKDSQADLLEVISGQVPIQAVWAERGYSREQIEESLKIIKALGLEGMLHQSPGQNPTQNNTSPTMNTTGS